MTQSPRRSQRVSKCPQSTLKPAECRAHPRRNSAASRSRRRSKLSTHRMTHSAQQQNVLRDTFEAQVSFQVVHLMYIARVAFVTVGCSIFLLLLQPRPFSFTPVWARKLTNSKKLVGHDGCVNRLAWNEDGSLLASGSDDRQVVPELLFRRIDPDHATFPCRCRCFCGHTQTATGVR